MSCPSTEIYPGTQKNIGSPGLCLQIRGGSSKFKKKKHLNGKKMIKAGSW
jgi:hypothetical protein